MRRPEFEWCASECTGPFEGRRVLPLEFQSSEDAVALGALPPDLVASIREFSIAIIDDDLPKVHELLCRKAARGWVDLAPFIRGLLRVTDVRCATPLIAYRKSGGEYEVHLLLMDGVDGSCREEIMGMTWVREFGRWRWKPGTGFWPEGSWDPLPSEQ